MPQLSACDVDSVGSALGSVGSTLGSVGFMVGSGVNLDIPADITTANDRSFVPETAAGGFKLTFYGGGANVRLTGDNTFVRLRA